MTDITNSDIDQLFGAVEEQLGAVGESCELVVIGGSALLALGYITRATRDVDLVALRSGQELIKPDPLPDALAAARDRVSRDFDLPRDWLNAAPAGLLDFGLPAGFIERLESRRYGRALVVHFASRLDQIHFKLYALVDRGPGKHESDLAALAPAREELVRAARWAMTHDPSEGFRQELRRTLGHLGVHDADLGP